MKKVIGRKYVSSKGAWIFLGIFFFLLSFGAGAFAFWLVRLNYESQLWEYRGGYSPDPTPPTEPIGWYVFIIIVSLFVALFFLWLFLHLGSRERAGNQAAVVYDTEKSVFRILQRENYLTIPAGAVTRIKIDNTHIMMAGKTPMIYHTSHGKLVIYYVAETKKRKIRTIEIQDAMEVAVQMEAIRRIVVSHE